MKEEVSEEAKKVKDDVDNLQDVLNRDVEGPVPLESGKTRMIHPQVKENWLSQMDSNNMVAGARACLIELLKLVLNAIGIVYDCSNIVRQSERGCCFVFILLLFLLPFPLLIFPFLSLAYMI